jgi:V/A-type H+-transporting ATPase subunit C
VPYGPETVFAYIAAKENEIRQARIILTCKANGVSPDVLRERLRDNYA